MIIPFQLRPGNSPKFSSDTRTSFLVVLISHTRLCLDAGEWAPWRLGFAPSGPLQWKSVNPVNSSSQAEAAPCCLMASCLLPFESI